MIKNKKLFVWGNHASSETGLTDGIIDKNKRHFSAKRGMQYPVEQPMFADLIH